MIKDITIKVSVLRKGKTTKRLSADLLLLDVISDYYESLGYIREADRPRPHGKVTATGFQFTVGLHRCYMQVLIPVEGTREFFMEYLAKHNILIHYTDNK